MCRMLLLSLITHNDICTLGRNSLDKWSARRRGLYLTTHITRKGQTSMPPVRFEPTISASERPQTHSLARAATGISNSTSEPLISTAEITGYSVYRCHFYLRDALVEDCPFWDASWMMLQFIWQETNAAICQQSKLITHSHNKPYFPVFM